MAVSGAKRHDLAGTPLQAQETSSGTWLVAWLVVAVAACGLGMSALQNIPAKRYPEASQPLTVLCPRKGPSMDLRRGRVRIVEPKRLQQLGCRRRSSEDAALVTRVVCLAEPTLL